MLTILNSIYSSIFLLEMPHEIGGLSHTEYLIAFLSIIFGYVGAEYFVGWGAMIRFRSKIKVYWLHLSWTCFSFLMFITNWYGIWPRTEYITVNIFYFFFSLIPLLIFYFINIILFPGVKREEYVDLNAYYTKNAPWLFILFAFYFIFTIVASFVYYNDPGNKISQNIIRTLGVVLSLLAAYYPKKTWLHISFLIFGLVGLLIFIFSIPNEG